MHDHPPSLCCGGYAFSRLDAWHQQSDESRGAPRGRGVGCRPAAASAWARRQSWGASQRRPGGVPYAQGYPCIMAEASNRAIAAVFVLLLVLLLSYLSGGSSRAKNARPKIVGSGRSGFRPIEALPVDGGFRRPSEDFLATVLSPPPPPLLEAAAEGSSPASSIAEQQQADDDPWSSESLRRKPEVRRAIRDALRAALLDADKDASADPLELLAERLLARRRGGHSGSTTGAAKPSRGAGLASGGGVASPASRTGAGGVAAPPPPPAASTAPHSASCIGKGGRVRRRCRPANGTIPYPPHAARRHNLPPKLPTAAMWPPLSTAVPSRAGTPAASEEDYRSLGKVLPYRGGDLERPGELAKAAAARAYKGELILTYGNEAGTAWIANLIFSLRAAGLDHSLVIVMSDEHCKALHRPPWMISCAWSSWDFGQNGTGGSLGMKRYEGKACKRPMEMRRLWYSRHHYMSRVIEELGLNVAVIDGDMSVRSDFYPELKRPPLREHNLIYTLDHGPKCGDLNVGMAYCQGCAPRGRSQWVIDEGLRREGYFCGAGDGGVAGDPRKEFGDGGAFWRASDGANVSAGPHHWIPWTTARDQKVYSDVVGGSCCGKPQYRLMFPSTHKVLDSYAFMRQWGQHAGCMTMQPQTANGLQTWWHQLLQGEEDGAARVETVAIATGRLASGWHGTGAGEMAGWAGHWHYKPPAIAHFVGGAPAGGKVDLMQGLNWWLYEADVVAHAVMEETGKKAGMALPPSFFSPRSQRGLLAISGAGARLNIPNRTAFTARFVELRFWLLQIAAVLHRTAVDPQPHCDSAWIPSDVSTHNRGGYRGKWYTPGWPWPFMDGVGVVVGNCSYPHGATQRAPRAEECCSVIFGVVKGAKCFETAHHMVLEQALAARAGERPDAVASTLKLSDVLKSDPSAAGSTGAEGAQVVDVEVLRGFGRVLRSHVVWLELPEAVVNGGPLPRLQGLDANHKEAIGSLVHEECAAKLRTIGIDPPPKARGGKRRRRR